MKDVRPLVVVSRPGDLANYHGPRLTADEFLEDDRAAAAAGAPVVNLCRSWRYLSKGYYVSLLAEARGLTVVPAPRDVLGWQPQRILRALEQAGVETARQEQRLRRAGGELPLPAPSKEVPPPLLVKQANGAGFRLATPDEVAEPKLLLGRSSDPRFTRVAAAVFRVCPLPILRVRLLREEKRWKVVSVEPLKLGALDEHEREQLVHVLEARRTAPRLAEQEAEPDAARASLAVLFEEGAAHLPSTPETIERLERVAQRCGLHVSRVGLRDLAHLGDYDALFIRTLTGPDLPSFAFALQAESLGMPVIDDTTSILRCCNKVFLHELLTRGGVPTPKTRVVARGTKFEELAAELGRPIVLKLPDGSFASAVFKVKDEEEWARRSHDLFERSPLLLAQEYRPTAFDWRVTTLAGEPLFACRYYMARGHWQIAYATGHGTRFGRVEAVRVDAVPPEVLAQAVRASKLVGNGLYGVDLKETPEGTVVIEVNDNPNIDLGYDDAVAGDTVYEALARHFLGAIEAGFKPKLPRRLPIGPLHEAMESWRRPIDPPEGAEAPQPYAPFSVCGIELEYALVDRDLNVVSRVEPALRLLAGRPTSDHALGVVGMSNEFADHVLELRTERPLRKLHDTEAVLLEGIRRVSALLADRLDARILPTGMHPWFDPKNARRWTRSNRRIYDTYARLFETQTHGWTNVQAMHVNLPLGEDEDAVALHNAAALLVPYLPAIAATSPLIDGELSDAVDNRLAYLIQHQSRIPESSGRMVPEPIASLAEYKKNVLQPMYKALDRLPDSGVLRREFLNVRSAVIRFSRRALEVRVLDVQECVHMDMVLAAFTRWALRALSDALRSGEVAFPAHDLLVEDLHAAVARGSRARVHAPHLPGLARGEDGRAEVRDVLRLLLERARTVAAEDELDYLERAGDLIEEGSLAERIAAELAPLVEDEDAFTEKARRVYIELADCLLENRPWPGRAAARQGAARRSDAAAARP